MKKGFLMLAAAAMVLFSSCNKDNEVSITFTSDNIMVDLGSSGSDLAKFAKASDGSAVTVSGVDFDKVGEQTATFKAGSASVDKTVKVSAKRLAGSYRIHVTDSAGTKELTEGNGWKLNITPGADYNQIDIPTVVGENNIFEGVDKLTVTFKDGKGSIPNYTGPKYLFVGGEGHTVKFQNITYEKNSEGMYALKGFTLKIVKEKFNDFYEQVRFDKLDELDEE
ncbi:MAG: hypothetical protein J6T56_04090 [Bacteroidales bacterium]|nr:hypothetical protein [Bacteroidales bacterium]MBP5395447.1 hypothetical protein [Bacteroidales bacterium]MBP5613817.1 hypothetical protein [Bacteroidales bacterium]